MITDTEIRAKGIRVLLSALGSVEAERFIALILREPFDYTQWQESLFESHSVDSLSNAAAEHRKTKSNQKAADNQLPAPSQNDPHDLNS